RAPLIRIERRRDTVPFFCGRTWVDPRGEDRAVTSQSQHKSSRRRSKRVSDYFSSNAAAQLKASIARTSEWLSFSIDRHCLDRHADRSAVTNHFAGFAYSPIPLISITTPRSLPTT